MAARAYIFVRSNGRAPLSEYLKSIDDQREVAVVQAAIERLMLFNGYLPRPYAAHVEDKLWELRTRRGNRVFYFIETGPEIILLDGYTKKRDRIEAHILERVRGLYAEYLTTRNRTPF